MWLFVLLVSHNTTNLVWLKHEPVVDTTTLWTKASPLLLATCGCLVL
jgi:hypothetical protein